MGAHALDAHPGDSCTPRQRAAFARLTEAQRLRWIDFNRTAAGYPSTRTVHGLFEEQAAAAPERVALLFGSASMTYGELDRRASALARRLAARGVGRDMPVGICIERSFEMIVALLATLKAGGAYLPVDPRDPAERLRAIADDAKPRVWLTSKTSAGALSGAGLEALVIDDGEGEVGGQAAPAPAEESAADATRLAYILYTSGSTGSPKGVCVEHRSVVRLVRGVSYARLDSETVLLQLAPLAFDASTFEIWGALVNGGRLAIAPSGPAALDSVGDLVRQHGVTTLWLTAGLFHLMVDHRIDELRPLRQLLSGGDVLSPARVRRFLDAVPGCQLINGYGPTETTTFAACHAVRVFPGANESVPIGRPISNTRIWLTDEAGLCVPPGEEGEICIGGDGVARGYLNRPALTAEKFLPDPFSDAPGARLYRSGDRGRLLADGTLEYLGRLDRQVKISGYRIEPEEIEAALEKHPAVSQAVVAPRESEGGTGERRLVAWLLPREGASWDDRELRRLVAASLPLHMVPSAFVRVESFPLTPSGKVDRRALPSPPEISAREAEEPRPGLESTVLRIWRQVLGRESIGLDENFFDAGGNSLALLEIHTRIRRELGRNLTLTTLFAKPTIRSLARHLDRRATDEDPLRELRDRLGRGRKGRGPDAG